MVKLTDDAFARVGLDGDSEHAREIAAALTRAATEVRARSASGELPAAWATLAANDVLCAMSRCELGDLVDALGQGAVAFPDDDPGDPADPARPVLHHLLRDRLADALRLGAGERPFWPWDAASR